MTITTFKNMKGIIHGKEQKRIVASTDGVLKVGTTEISVSPNGDSILPILFHGATGDYDATFTDLRGNAYNLGRVAVRAGRISPPSQRDVEIMELRCRLDSAEDECEELRQEVQELRNIFDTNSLNFLIK